MEWENLHTPQVLTSSPDELRRSPVAGNSGVDTMDLHLLDAGKVIGPWKVPDPKMCEGQALHTRRVYVLSMSEMVAEHDILNARRMQETDCTIG